MTDEQHQAFIGVMASLAAAISLLEKGGKKAAPSDKMFAQMLADYKAALETAHKHINDPCLLPPGWLIDGYSNEDGTCWVARMRDLTWTAAAQNHGFLLTPDKKIQVFPNPAAAIKAVLPYTEQAREED
jgi:hypothetical protein